MTSPTERLFSVAEPAPVAGAVGAPDSSMSKPKGRGRSTVVIRRVVVPIAGLPSDLEGKSIAHVSDFHFRRWGRVLAYARDLLETLPYDLLVATGDYSAWPRAWRHARGMVRDFFEPLADRGPCLAVLGNHDDPRLLDGADLPLTFLRNESRRVELGAGSIVVAGLDQNHNKNECLSTTMESVDGEAVTILLAHYPSTVYRLGSHRVDLLLAGHTHGGQIRLPLLGCLWTHDRLPTRMARGLHRVDRTWLHVSAGLGVSPPILMRINCPPEISILTLTGC